TLAGAQFAAPAISASVLFLVPGVPMVSSIADLFRGDTVSGVARLASAVLLVVAIAAGLWAMLLLTQAQIDFTPGRLDLLLLAVPLAALATAGFAIMFDVPYRVLLPAALVGGAGYAVYRLAGLAGLPSGAAAFLAGLMISLLSELLARVLRMPTSMFSIPGFLPLVPGAAAFRALLDFAADDYAAGSEGFVRTIIIVMALAAGIGTVNALVRLGRRPVV
ncbi:MAG: threonine/serine exporter family protein, partial [Roseiflexaceae bacterium]|nr:threonine/serine exporter family protein [Roseiflexaceae bacterium]